MAALIFHPGSPQPDKTVQVVRYQQTDSDLRFHRVVRPGGAVEWEARGKSSRPTAWAWSSINCDAVLVDATNERVDA